MTIKLLPSHATVVEIPFLLAVRINNSGTIFAMKVAVEIPLLFSIFINNSGSIFTVEFTVKIPTLCPGRTNSHFRLRHFALPLMKAV